MKIHHFLRPTSSNSATQMRIFRITRQYCVDSSKVVDEINLKFAKAREEIQTTLDSKEIMYFDERLLAKLPKKENGAIYGAQD
ncbi:hypothetical protein CsSME_00036228 [Camellia sinensis var. sinensis]